MKKLIFTQVYPVDLTARSRWDWTDEDDGDSASLPAWSATHGAEVSDEVYLAPATAWVPMRRIVH